MEEQCKGMASMPNDWHSDGMELRRMAKAMHSYARQGIDKAWRGHSRAKHGQAKELQSSAWSSKGIALPSIAGAQRSSVMHGEATAEQGETKKGAAKQRQSAVERRAPLRSKGKAKHSSGKGGPNVAQERTHKHSTRRGLARKG